MIRFLIVLLIFTLPTVADAASCNVNLSAHHTYEDLRSMLVCLQGRIDELETPGGGGVSGRAVDQRLSQIRQAVAGKKTHEYKGIIYEIEKCAWSSSDGELYCLYNLRNKKTSDIKICLGSESRLSTDTGASFSRSGGYRKSIGSVSNWSGSTACDIVPPLSKIKAWIRFSNSKGQANSKVQFVRLDCGSGCQFDAFDIPIE